MWHNVLIIVIHEGIIEIITKLNFCKHVRKMCFQLTKTLGNSPLQVDVSQ